MSAIGMRELIELNRVLSKYVGIDFPLKTSYKMAKIKAEVEKELSFFQEKYETIINQYAEKDEFGKVISEEEGTFKVKAGKEEECRDSIKELESFQITLSSPLLKISELGDTLISPMDTYGLLFVIDDEEE